MIRRAVIPAAGMGTRLLPATKAQPKEMLPILDTPAIQYVIQEAVDAGIRDLLIVTDREKGAIERYFQRDRKLEAHLERRGDHEALAWVRNLALTARIDFVQQSAPAGLGDAIGCGRTFVGDEPFAVLLGDTIMDGPIPATRQLLDAYEEHRVPILAVEEVPAEKVSRYGIVEGTPLKAGRLAVTRLIEKPFPGETESTLAIAGRYILTPEVFQVLRDTRPGRHGEIQLTDALSGMLEQGTMVAVSLEGRRFDIGNKLDYLTTVLAFALKREEYAGVVRSALASLERRDAQP